MPSVACILPALAEVCAFSVFPRVKLASMQIAAASLVNFVSFPHSKLYETAVQDS